MRQGALWPLLLALVVALLSGTGCGSGTARPAKRSPPEKPVPSKKEAGQRPFKPFETIKPH
jgi:hypothetical protein